MSISTLESDEILVRGYDENYFSRYGIFMENEKIGNWPIRVRENPANCLVYQFMKIV